IVGMDHCVVRIDLHGLLFQHSCSFIVASRELELRGLCTKMQVMAGQACSAEANCPLATSGLDASAYSSSDRLDDVVLQGKDVVHILVVPIRPDVTAGKRVDELSGEPHTVAQPADAAFQHEPYAEFAPDALHVNVFPSILERRIASYDEQR